MDSPTPRFSPLCFGACNERCTAQRKVYYWAVRTPTRIGPITKLASMKMARRKREPQPAEPFTPSGLGLRGIKLLEGLAPAALEALARNCNWRHAQAGQRIISRQATDRDVYMIIRGRVRATAFSAAGRQVTFRDIVAGEVFGDLSAIDGQARSADVMALEPSFLASLSPESYRKLLREHPVIAERVMVWLAHSVRELSERVFDLTTLGVQNRVHAEVLYLARQAGVEGNRARIDPAPKQADIASQVSTYREQVTREFSAMTKDGLIKRDGRALVVLDVARLARLVDEVRRSA